MCQTVQGFPLNLTPSVSEKGKTMIDLASYAHAG